MEPDRETSTRLGAAMNQRRLELRPPLKWNQVAERAGMSIGHLSRIRNGEARPSPTAAAQIEAALKWEPGTVARIEAGDEMALQPAREPAAPDLLLDLPEIENPTEREKFLMNYIASMHAEMRTISAKVEALEERDRLREEGGSAHKKGA